MNRMGLPRRYGELVYSISKLAETLFVARTEESVGWFYGNSLDMERMGQCPSVLWRFLLTCLSAGKWREVWQSQQSLLKITGFANLTLESLLEPVYLIILKQLENFETTGLKNHLVSLFLNKRKKYKNLKNGKQTGKC